MCKVAGFRSHLRWQWIVCAVLLAAVPMLGQDSASAPQQGASDSSLGSIASAARNAKAQKAHAKKVISDDDVENSIGPLPRLVLNGPDNADEVISAIVKYQRSHTPEQTEAAVHTWYDRYSEMFEAAERENQNTRTLGDANLKNGYDLCMASQDYEQCQNRRMAEYRSAQNDQTVTMKNTQLTMKIQQALTKVQGGLAMRRIQYEWFKIPSQNSNF